MYLVFSILASTGIFILFKLFKIYNVNTLHAIVVNYLTAFIFGISVYKAPITIQNIISAKWFYAAFGLGFLFITIFNVMALTAQKNGLSVASVASKMSVIIPIGFGVVVLHENLGALKIIGVLLALVAVYLTSVKPHKSTTQKLGFIKPKLSHLLLPVILFLGSGIIDTSVNYFAPQNNTTIALFSATIFGFAFCIGIGVVVYKTKAEHTKFQLKSIVFGAVLGIVNYASIYYLIKALRMKGFDSSVLFTINNVAIVAVSTIVGLLLFKERISFKNYLGIAMAIIAIILVSV